MSPVRLAIGLTLLAALAITLVLVLVASRPEQTEAAPLTTSVATTVTLPSTKAAPSTQPEPVPTAPPTTTAEQRKAEVAAILQNLWFGWFDAIYRQDTDALWDVVATNERFESGLEAMSEMTFTTQPEPRGVSIDLHEILLDRPDCLVAHATLDVSAFRGAGAFSRRVDVMWPAPNGHWRRATGWANPGDLWLADCDLRVREETP